VLSARLDGADPTFGLSLVEVEPPPLPRPDWARVAVDACGICGSDLAILFPHGRGSVLMLPFVGAPMEMGHEISGTVVEAGPECPTAVGTPVAIDPTLACTARGLAPCPRCREGALSTCLRLDDAEPVRGWAHGFASGVGGGWSEQLVCHHSQLHPVPDGVDAVTAALTEPLAVCLHGLLRSPPIDGEPALVVGAGSLGLVTVVALAHLAPRSEVTVLARHQHQAAAARRVGARHVVMLDDDGGHFEQIASLGGGRVTGRGRARQLVGGYMQVAEAVGTPAALGLAMVLAGQRSVLWAMGAVGVADTDLTPLYQKELELFGSLGYGVEEHGGVRQHTFDRALGVLAGGGLDADLLVTHSFPLPELREAVEVAHDRAHGSVKVMVLPHR